MRKNISASILTIGALGALATACAANTGAADESTGGTSQADSTCGSNQNPNADNIYQNDSCYSFVQDRVFSGDASYANNSTCPNYVAEWDGTAYNNPSGLFTVSVTPGATIAQASCAQATINVTVFGLEEYVNGRYSYSNWMAIANVTARGQWTNGYCELVAATSFSDTVPSPSPDDLRRYQDIKVSAQAYTPPYLRLKGSNWEDYLPVNVWLSQQGQCP